MSGCYHIINSLLFIFRRRLLIYVISYIYTIQFRHNKMVTQSLASMNSGKYHLQSLLFTHYDMAVLIHFNENAILHVRKTFMA